MEKAVSNCKVVRDLGEGGRSSYSDSAESTQMPPYQFSDPTLEQWPHFPIRDLVQLWIILCYYLQPHNQTLGYIKL